MSESVARVRSPEEAIDAVRSSLRSIVALCAVYDAGDHTCARDIATIISRMIVDEVVQTKQRRDLRFVSYVPEPNPRNLLGQDLATLTDVNFKSDGHNDLRITVTHQPMLSEMAAATGRPVAMRFNDWWNGLVWVSGAADGLLIPTDEAKHIPFNKRERLSRLSVIDTFRNKVGAHYDRGVDARVHWIEDRLLRTIDIAANVGSQRITYSQTPELFKFTNARAQAIVRHIAFEIQQSQGGWPFMNQ